MYEKAQAVRKPAGHIAIDGRIIADTLQCCHCGQHWVPIKGSGIRRGFCMACMKPTCGGSQCDPCAPAEIRLLLMENPEAGRREFQKHALRLAAKAGRGEIRSQA